MRLYDEIIRDILTFLGEQDAHILPVGAAADPVSRDWQDAGKAMMILQSDMAYRLYNTIRNIGYFRYHIYPKGFMLRVSSSNDRESVRVEAEALNEGLNFTAIGNAMLRALHLHKEVEAVRIIFVTDPKVDYGRLQDGLKKTKQITATIDHMLKDVNMDCGSCGLQEICILA